MTEEFGGKPGDERGFLHKKILGLVGKVGGILPIPGAGAISTIARTLAGSGKTVPRTLTARPTQFSAGEKELGRQLKFGNGNGKAPATDCRIPGQRRDQFGRCSWFFGERRGPNGDAPTGDAVMGMHGPGVEPGIQTIDRAVCGRKMVLGDDGLCYHKTQISNKERMWPKGRKPLLTGGDLNAVSTASRVGRRMDDMSARLRHMGLMKPLPKRRKAHHHHPAA